MLRVGNLMELTTGIQRTEIMFISETKTKTEDEYHIQRNHKENGRNLK